jgi:NADPH:quinone reductase-like Zn-dependent oxidoreductase
MRAIQVTGFGPPEVLALATVSDPTPAPGEVRVRIHAIGVNFSDTERRRAVFDAPELPWIPGREAAGVIDVVGEGVAPALVGARVAYYSRRRGGAYAELATVAVDELLHFPTPCRSRPWPLSPSRALPLWGAGSLRSQRALRRRRTPSRRRGRPGA